MNLRESNVGTVTVLALEGRLDAVGSPMLENRAAELVAAGTNHLVLECSGLTYVSSAGLRAILVASKKAVGAGGSLSVASPSEIAQEVFEIAGLTRVLEVHPTTEAAVNSVRTRA